MEVINGYLDNKVEAPARPALLQRSHVRAGRARFSKDLNYVKIFIKRIL